MHYSVARAVLRRRSFVGGVAALAAVRPPPLLAEDAGRITVPFGALTLAGAGGVEVPGLDTLPEALSRDFVLSDGRIAPSNAGNEVKLSRGPYVGRLSDGRDFAIEVLAGTYSVASMVELKAAVEHPDLAYGEAILLRAGLYTPGAPGEAVLQRLELPRGAAPTDGPVLVSTHEGGGVIEHLFLGKNTSDFAYRGLTFRTKRRKGAKYRGAVEIAVPLYNLIFEKNSFTYGKKIDGTEPDVVGGIFSPGNIRVDGLKIVGNRFDGVTSAIAAPAGNGIVIDRNEIRRATIDDIRINRGRNMRISNNLLTDKVQAASAFRVMDVRPDGKGGMFIVVDRPLPRGRAVENVVLTPDTGVHPDLARVQFSARKDFDRDKDIDRATLSIRIRKVNQSLLRYRFTGGGRLLVTAEHSDAIQIFSRDQEYSPGDYDGMTIIGNTILIGKGSLGFNTRQGGLWVQSGRNMRPKAGWKVIGNVIEHVGRNGMVIGGLRDARIWSNVVVRRLNYPNVNGITESVIRVDGTGSLYDNIANAFDLSGWRGVKSGNITVPADNVAAYRSLFRDPTIGDAEYFGRDYGGDAYAPARGAPGNAGRAGWDSARGAYTGSR